MGYMERFVWSLPDVVQIEEERNYKRVAAVVGCFTALFENPFTEGTHEQLHNVCTGLVLPVGKRGRGRSKSSVDPP
jgi:hypothetical protein